MTKLILNAFADKDNEIEVFEQALETEFKELAAVKEQKKEKEDFVKAKKASIREAKAVVKKEQESIDQLDHKAQTIASVINSGNNYLQGYLYRMHGRPH